MKSVSIKCVLSLRKSRGFSTALFSTANQDFVSSQSVSPVQYNQVPILDCVKNFRDIAHVDNKLASARIFRTACVSSASSNDVQILSEKLQIRTFIDLRSAREIQNDNKINSTVYKDFEDINYNAKSKSLVWSSTSVTKKRFFVSYLNEIAILKDAFRRLLVKEKIKLSFLALSSVASSRAKAKTKQLLVKVINNGGLILLNEFLIDHAGQQIVATLKILADPNCHPVAFYCTAGKDRTGVLAMILLKVLQIEDSKIIEDYTLSDSVYRDLEDSNAMVVAMKQSDLDPNKFLHARAETMQHAINYLNSKYGSVDSYLDKYGFDDNWRSKLRNVLLK